MWRIFRLVSTARFQTHNLPVSSFEWTLKYVSHNLKVARTYVGIERLEAQARNKNSMHSNEVVRGVIFNRDRSICIRDIDWSTDILKIFFEF